MSQVDGNMSEEAAGWYIRQRDPARADWDAFMVWLDADPAHNAAYEAVALADRDYGDLVEESRGADTPSNDNVAAPRHRRWFMGLGSSAAAVVALFVAYPMISPSAATYAVQTGAGERKAVTLQDGTRIELNGGTSVTLRRGDTRYATLDRGEAMFTVTHNADAPFEVRAGDTTLRDVGTVFNVVRSETGTEAAIAEGAVMLNPGAQAVRLDAGRTVRVSSGGDVTVGKVDPATVGTWRKDRLVYQDAPLSRIAADLSRNLGTPISVAPALQHEHFSGVIMLDGNRTHLLRRIGSLLDVDTVQSGGAWRLVPRKTASN